MTDKLAHTPDHTSRPRRHGKFIVQQPEHHLTVESEQRSASLSYLEPPSEELIEIGDVKPDAMPRALERVTRAALREMLRILSRKPDWKDGNLLRAKINAAGIALNAQLRADEARLRAKVHTNTLARLLKVVEQQKKIISGSE